MSGARCGQELCANWTGDGCACAVFGIEAACGPCNAGIHEQCPKLSGCCCEDEDLTRPVIAIPVAAPPGNRS